MNYKFHATSLIAEAFSEKDLYFQIDCPDAEAEILSIPFGIDGGPMFRIRFISRDEDNDVAVRAFRIVNDTPVEKHNRVQQVCTHLNRAVRYLKFYMTESGDVNVEYDIPQETSDSCLGDICLELCARFSRALNKHYPLFVKAIFTDLPMEQILKD